MKASFHGATNDEAGSAYHMKTKQASVLLDRGTHPRGKKSGDVIEN